MYVLVFIMFHVDIEIKGIEHPSYVSVNVCVRGHTDYTLVDFLENAHGPKVIPQNYKHVIAIIDSGASPKFS